MGLIWWLTEEDCWNIFIKNQDGCCWCEEEGKKDDPTTTTTTTTTTSSITTNTNNSNNSCNKSCSCSMSSKAPFPHSLSSHVTSTYTGWIRCSSSASRNIWIAKIATCSWIVDNLKTAHERETLRTKFTWKKKVFKHYIPQSHWCITQSHHYIISLHLKIFFKLATLC